jgi:nucleoside-diphosphate kinase
MKERTLSILKPDVTKRNLIGKVETKLEEAGLRIIAQKMIKLTREQAEEFYAVHKGKFFFDELINYMLTGRIVVQVLEGENAIMKNREIMGKTNPAEAAKGTIRGNFGVDNTANCAHGSDSLETAKKEIDFFFGKEEIFG